MLLSIFAPVYSTRAAGQVEDMFRRAKMTLREIGLFQRIITTLGRDVGDDREGSGGGGMQ